MIIIFLTTYDAMLYSIPAMHSLYLLHRFLSLMILKLYFCNNTVLAIVLVSLLLRLAYETDYH